MHEKIFMSYSDLVATIALVVSISAVPASGFLSYRFAIKWDKRKEFNAVSDGLRTKIRSQIRLLEDGYYPASGKHEISDTEMDSLIDLSCAKAKPLISQQWKTYKKALEDGFIFDEYGDYDSHNAENIQSALQKLLTFTERR